MTLSAEHSGLSAFASGMSGAGLAASGVAATVTLAAVAFGKWRENLEAATAANERFLTATRIRRGELATMRDQLAELRGETPQGTARIREQERKVADLEFAWTEAARKAAEYHKNIEGLGATGKLAEFWTRQAEAQDEIARDLQDQYQTEQQRLKLLPQLMAAEESRANLAAITTALEKDALRVSEEKAKVAIALEKKYEDQQQRAREAAAEYLASPMPWDRPEWGEEERKREAFVSSLEKEGQEARFYSQLGDREAGITRLFVERFEAVKYAREELGASDEELQRISDEFEARIKHARAQVGESEGVGIAPPATDEREGWFADIKEGGLAEGFMGRINLLKAEVKSLGGVGAEVANTLTVGFADRLGSAFAIAASGAKRMKDVVKDVLRGLIMELTKTIVKAIALRLLMAAFGIAPPPTGGLGAAAGGSAGWALTESGNVAPTLQAYATPQLPGFARGGSFMVGGNGGIDQNLVSFRATRGERVTIDPAGGGRGGNVIVNVINNTGASVSQLERAGVDGGREIEIVVGLAIARDFGRGGPAARAAQSAFGLRRIPR